MSSMSESDPGSDPGSDAESDAPPPLHQPSVTPYLIELSWLSAGCCDVDISMPTLRLSYHLHVHASDDEAVMATAMREIMQRLAAVQRPRGDILN